MTPPAIAPALECREVLRFPAETGATLDAVAGVDGKRVPVSAGVVVLLALGGLDTSWLDAVDAGSEEDSVGVPEPGFVVGTGNVVELDPLEPSSTDD